MIGLQKKRLSPGDYVVPNNSVLNLPQKTGLYNPTPNAMDQSPKAQGADGKCRYCENMAKNFLYLESLIRNNGDKGEKKCALCNSSLKYLEYVNRNIRQVFGNFDAIVQADRALAAKPATFPKYSVAAPAEKVDPRAKGGAIVSAQKSIKSLKSKIASLKAKNKSLEKMKAFRGQKSLKSLKSSRSTKSSKSLKSSKLTKALKSEKSAPKLAKSGSKAMRKGLAKSKSFGQKSQTSHGKMVLKRKFRGKGAPKVVRSVSEYRNLGASRSKLSKGPKKMAKQRPPTSINWRLLKQNLPRRNPVK